MKTQLMSVSKSGNLPAISIQSSWLPDIGFVPGALVQAIPEADGMTFNLCNEYIMNYSDLSCRTREKGGKLIQIGSINKGSLQYSSLSVILGRKFRTECLSVGDPLAAGYDCGIIRVRKLPGAEHLTVGSFNSQRERKLITSFILNEKWLADAGFVPDALVTADASIPGYITIKLWDGKLERYGELVKYARVNNLKLLQVRKKQNMPWIGITGAFITKAGFCPGDIFQVDFEHGIIKSLKLDISVLGF